MRGNNVPPLISRLPNTSPRRVRDESNTLRTQDTALLALRKYGRVKALAAAAHTLSRHTQIHTRTNFRICTAQSLRQYLLPMPAGLIRRTRSLLRPQRSSCICLVLLYHEKRLALLAISFRRACISCTQTPDELLFHPRQHRAGLHRIQLCSPCVLDLAARNLGLPDCHMFHISTHGYTMQVQRYLRPRPRTPLIFTWMTPSRRLLWLAR